MDASAPDQAAKAARFRALHDGPNCFVLPNPWDAGTARLLTAAGFAALATTSAGFAHALGRRDGVPGRAETLANARAIVDATELPVSADLEGGFGPLPADCAETIRMAAAAGLVGGSIEDTTGDPARPIHDHDQAVERVAAAAAAARALPFPFTLTARADGFLHGRRDLDDAIRRLQAFAAAGADVLYAPGLPDLDAVRTLCAAVARPVNVLASPALRGAGGAPATVTELAVAGARRISLGGALSRVALGALRRVAAELQAGRIGFLSEAIPHAEVEALMRPA